MHPLSFITTLSFVTLGLADYTWPNPIWDQVEQITHVQTGLFGSGMVDSITPCRSSREQIDIENQSPADWVRTAFHDMASYDAASGTGGIDGSLQWETTRDENKGGHSFNEIIQFFLKFYSVRTSMADIIALGTYTAVRNCGGPGLLMKAGRVDASGPAPEGRLPAPRHDIQTLTQKFASAGFNQKDMIQMVACGHTMGGVHKEAFPEITAGSRFSDFDRTEGKFDHRIASEYLDSTTKNPLVRAPNDNNSDFKIFNSDGNSTIRAMSTPKTFGSTCESILQRMIDTVPSSVELSPPLAPMTVKPHLLQLELLSSGALQLGGYIRVKDDGKGRPRVGISYKDRDGKSVSEPIATKVVRGDGGMGTGPEASFRFFEIAPNTLPNGISSFVVTVSPTHGGTHVYDNNGQGYPVQDKVIFQESQSCLVKRKSRDWKLTLTAAIKDGMQSPSMNVVVKTSRPDTIVPLLDVKTSPMELWRKTKSGYTLYRGTYDLPASSNATTVDVWTNGPDGTRYEDAYKSTISLSEQCGTY